MSGLEVNKIIASILIAIIVIGAISLLGDIIANQKNNDQLQNAYKIDIPETDSTELPSNNEDDSIDNISLILASASSEKGEKLFKKCGACHTYKKEGVNKVGPNLWNLINSNKASKEGFLYSKALSEFGGKWGYEELSQFLYKPKEYIEGTKMNFSGIKNIEDRADLILFLRNQADAPAQLP